MTTTRLKPQAPSARVVDCVRGAAGEYGAMMEEADRGRAEAELPRQSLG